MMEMYTLKEVCELTGVSRRAIQGYEEAELVCARERNKYGHLLYGEEELERIGTIKMHQDFGFSIKEIEILLEASELDYETMMLNRMLEMQKEITVLRENVNRMKKLLELDLRNKLKE